MTISTDRQKLIDRVIKLMSLAEGTNHSAEAESARNMAIELMAKHSISYSDMSSEELDFTVEIEDSNRSRKATEETILINAIAEFSGIAFVTNSNGPKILYKFIGTKNDIEAFKYTLNIVHNQRQSAWLASGKKGSNNQYHFRMGYAMGVASKVFKIMNEMNSKVQEWGLVPVSQSNKAIDWYKTQRTVNSGRASSASKYDRGAFAAGQNVSLCKGVTSATLAIGR